MTPGDIARLESATGSILSVVEVDAGLRRGILSMQFGYGESTEHDHEVRSIGSNVARLVDDETDFDRYSGQPRMSNLVVHVTRIGPSIAANT